MSLGSTQPLVNMSTKNIPGGKGGRCVRLTSPTSRAECHEIWEPKPPRTLWTTPGPLRDSLPLFLYIYTVFARVICALFFSILAAEKSGSVKYADFFCGGLDLGFILV